METIRYIDRHTRSLCQETVPGEQWLKWLYHNPIGKLALHALVKRKALTAWYGKQMDTPKSCAKIRDFVDSLHIDMAESTRPIEDFTSFNDFFIRELKPGTRPIAPESNALASPADGKVLAFEGITGLDTFFVKGQQFSLSRFLQTPALSDTFAGGTLLIFRLAPVDYHRFHFPAAGRISATTRIDGSYYSVSPYAVKNRLQIYWENKREFSVLQTDIADDVLLCEVGATMVGGIQQTYTPESSVNKGDQKGWFTFGGSTVVMLLQQGAATIDADILANTQKGFETSVKVGEQIAVGCR